eukprot:2700664-Pleurochrysis_carterae.AAC.1
MLAVHLLCPIKKTAFGCVRTFHFKSSPPSPSLYMKEYIDVALWTVMLLLVIGHAVLSIRRGVAIAEICKWPKDAELRPWRAAYGSATS